MPRGRRSFPSEQPPGPSEPGALPDREATSEEDLDDGVDEGLIRWMLSLTPTERLEWAQDMVDTVEALRESREP